MSSIELLKSLEWLEENEIKDIVLRNINEKRIHSIKSNLYQGSDKKYSFGFNCRMTLCEDCIFYNSKHEQEISGDNCYWFRKTLNEDRNNILNLELLYNHCEIIWRIMNEFN